jgi:hypothetical protein
MSTSCRFSILAGLMMCMLCSVPQQARAFAIFTVGAGCPYSTIQEALTAAYYSPGEDYVWIANNATYSAQHITVGDQDVDIEGGFSDCNDFDIGPNDYTTISGAGNDGGPVFEISGNSHVYLGNLVIAGAQPKASQCGGGVSFKGQGTLTVGNATISNNSACSGGGIYVAPVGGPASLTLHGNTLVIFNSASNGGGITIAGGQPGGSNAFNVSFTMDEDGTLVGYNNASLLGGGVLVQDLAVAHVASPGYNGLGVIYGNSAGSGGGLAVNMRFQSSAGGTTVNLSGSDPARPVRIQSNNAAYAGGGVYVAHGTAAFSLEYPKVYLNASGFRIDDNIAPEGAALFTETNPPAPNPNSHGVTYVNLTNGNGLSNSIDGNGALDSLGNPTGGSTVLFQTDGELKLQGTSLRNNTAAHILRTLSPQDYAGSVSVGSVLIADNTVSSDVISIEGSSYASDCFVFNVTMTHNTLGAGDVYSGCNLDLYYDILDQPGAPALAYVGAQYGLYAAFILASDPATLPPNAVVPGAPLYVNAAGGDYHLTAASPGVDAAFDDFVQTSYDLDGNPRVKDLTSVPNAQGLGQDIGAFEMQYVCAPDELFCSAFGG